MDYAMERARLLSELAKDEKNRELRADLLRCDCLLCEENVQDMGPGWKNPMLIREILHWAPPLLASGTAEMYELVYKVCDRSQDTLRRHPRLMVQLLQLKLDAAVRMDEVNDEEMETPQAIEGEIARLNKNIAYADSGAFDKIEQSGHLKSDPVEWTARWEAVIDSAEEKADERLGDEPRGMGFCHSYWSALSDILAKDYGLVWRSPSLMNPRVLFD